MWVKVEDVRGDEDVGGDEDIGAVETLAPDAFTIALGICGSRLCKPLTRRIFREKNKQLYRNDCYEGVTNICTSLQTASEALSAC